MGCGPQVIVMTCWHLLCHHRHNKSPMKLDNIFDRNRKQRFPWEQIWQLLCQLYQQDWQELTGKADRRLTDWVWFLDLRAYQEVGLSVTHHKMTASRVICYFILNSFCIFYFMYSWRIWWMFEHFLLGNIQVLCGRLYIEQKPSQVENWIRKDGNSEKIIFYYEKKRKGICYN